MYSPNTLVVRCEDCRFAEDESNCAYQHHLFIRLVAKDRTFTKVNFRYCTFDGCYLRDCKFLACDFTGCRFLSTNLNGSAFSTCQFEYATFERTQIAPDILETQAPDRENLKERFARNLRTNYQQLAKLTKESRIGRGLKNCGSSAKPSAYGDDVRMSTPKSSVHRLPRLAIQDIPSVRNL